MIAEFQSRFLYYEKGPLAEPYLFSPNAHPGQNIGLDRRQRPAMPAHPFPEPPTRASLASAKRTLQSNRASIQTLTAKITAAEEALAQIIRESRCAINELEGEKTRLVQEELATLAYLSPVRRLPQELVREIFMWCFEEHPCCAWVLAAVSTSWRRLALRMPLLWSKVSSYHAVFSFSCTLLHAFALFSHFAHCGPLLSENDSINTLSPPPTPSPFSAISTSKQPGDISC